MSDQDAPDPIDQTYVQAEGMLDQDSARAARRARVLSAVAAQPAPTMERFKARSNWGRRGGWLMAACVAGFAAILSIQMSPTGDLRQDSLPMAPPVAEQAAPSDEAQMEPTPALSSVSPPPAAEVAAQARRASPGPVPVAAPPPVAPPPPSASISAPERRVALAPASPSPPPSPPPMAFPAPQDARETVVTARRAEAPSSAAPSAKQSSAASLDSASTPSPTLLGTSLRAAAAAGRTTELAELLAEGAPVDAVDSRGETALMKSVQANRPAAAALLRRYGANLDLENRAGVSAREMAASADDADLNRALGLAP